MKSLAAQAQEFAETYPIGCKVKVDGIIRGTGIGEVIGYEKGRYDRQHEMGMTVMMNGYTLLQYPDEIEFVSEGAE